MGEAGIGKAIRSLVLNEKENEHRVLCLEGSQKRGEIEKCIGGGIVVLEKPSRAETEQEIVSSDLVVIHWWDYPPMAEFLAHFSQVFCRIILWCHVSGCTYPFLPYDFLDLFHKILFTSPYSYENQEWSIEEQQKIKEKSAVVYGLSDIETDYVKKDYKIAPTEFVLAYVGTFTRSKIHPEFINVCKEIVDRIPSSMFLMIGEDGRADWLKEQALVCGIENHFIWTGFIDHVYKKLQESDVFFYPLNPFHFGTTENVILEAMAVGVPIVMMNQATEKYIIQDGKSGLLAKDKYQLVAHVCSLYQKGELRKELGSCARREFLLRYQISDNVVRFCEIASSCMQLPKRQYNFTPVMGTKPFDWFIKYVRKEDKFYFVENDKKGIEGLQAIYKEKTKSSIVHFHSYFPEDKKLCQLKKTICSHEGIE